MATIPATCTGCGSYLPLDVPVTIVTRTTGGDAFLCPRCAAADDPPTSSGDRPRPPSPSRSWSPPSSVWMDSAISMALRIAAQFGEAEFGHNLGREAGGFLCGQEYSDGSIEVIRVSDSPDEGRDHRQVRLYPEQLVALERAFSGPGELVCGDWHCHPNGNPEGSDMDKRQWLRLANFYGRSWISAVAVPLGPGSPSWRFVWYRTDPDGRTTDIDVEVTQW